MTTPDTPKSVNSVTLFLTRCQMCMSYNVILDGSFRFDIAEQEWVYSSDCGDYYCCECDCGNVGTDHVTVEQAVQDLKAALADLPAWVETADVSTDVDDENDMHYLRERMTGELAELETYL